MDKNNNMTMTNYDLNKINNLNTVISNDNITSSSPSSINNKNNYNNMYADRSKQINELRLKRKKVLEIK